MEQQLRADLDGLANKYAALYGMYNELLEEAQKKLDGLEFGTKSWHLN